MKKKVLYVDIPFLDSGKEHYSRSLFIGDLLKKNYTADLLLIKTPEYLTKPHTNPTGFNQIFALAATAYNLIKPGLIYQFSKDNLDKYYQILQSNQYDIVFFRLFCCYDLIHFTESSCFNCNIIVDIDYLFSNKLEKEWQNKLTQTKSLRQKLNFASLSMLEKKLFKKPHHFFFSHKKEKACALRIAGLNSNSTNFWILPNVLPKISSTELKLNISEKDKASLSDKYILFFGDLDSPEYIDAFENLAKNIYPRNSKKMQEKDIKIYVAGKGTDKIYEQYSGGRIKLIGNVENHRVYVKNCLFVVLPFRIASESLNSILESAFLKKAVLTTSYGIENLDFSVSDLAVENSVDSFCHRLEQMLQNPGDTIEMGINLNLKAKSLYDRTNIEKSFKETLNIIANKPSPQSHSVRQKIAVIVNEFHLTDNEIECRLFCQIKRLAEIYSVTVFCPRKAGETKRETLGQITIYRLSNLQKYTLKKSHHKSKALCPELLMHLLNKNFDIIQCYPGISINNILAFLVAKFREIPIIMVSTGVIEYSDIFKTNGKVNPDILKTHTFSWITRMFLKNLDYIFTVSEKEYAILRKLNIRIEQIPVQINDPIQEEEVSSLQENYNLSSDTYIFLCMGDFTYLNGQDIALKAYTKALPCLPDSRLILIGNMEIEPEFTEEIESYIERESLGDVVIQVSNIDECSLWLKEADIGIIAARFLIGNAITNACWLSDIPVIQSDAVDPNQVIEGYNGYLFRTEDIEDLAWQMQKAHTDKTKLLKMAEHGKTLIKDRNSIEYLFKRFVKVYKQLTT